MFPWTESQLAAFPEWAEANSQNHALWYLLLGEQKD